MPRIQANRDSIDDRFSVLGFSVRTESPLFEVGVATDPGLFRAERRGQRNRRNFYSSRGIGVIRARRGEAVYLVPPEVLANFVGQQRLYFGLATYRENSRGKPDYVQAPGDGHMYVNMSGLTERGLRRLTGRGRNGASYGAANGPDPSLDWGGDTWPQAASSASSSSTAPVASTAPAPYDDGFGSFPAPQAAGTTAPATSTTSPGAETAAPARNYAGTGTATAASPTVAPAPSAATPPLATAQELLLKPYGGGSGGLLEQLGFLLSGVPWFAGVNDTTGFPHSAICRTYATAANGKKYVGTAFYIGRNVLLTAAHVVEGMTSIDIVPGKNGAGGDSAHEAFGRFTVGPGDWVRHESYNADSPDSSAFDFAVIRASRPVPNDRWFSLEELRQSRPEGVVVCGYSTNSRQTDTLSRLVNMAIDPEKQHLHSGHVRFLGTEETFDYDVQTLPGASGAPVYSILGTDALTAVVSGVHVSRGTDSTNKGCRLTDAKIAWIRARAAEFGVASPMSLRGEAPAALRPASRTTPAPTARSDAQGMFDLLPVDLKLRVFIPAPAVMATIPVVGGAMPIVSAKGGDGRGFQFDSGTSRAELTARFHFGGGGAKPTLTDLKRSFGESTNYNRDDTVAVPGKPEWYRNLRPGAKPIERGTQTVSDDKLNVALGGSANDGIVSMAQNAVVVTFNLHASDPIVTGAPDIDATLAVLLKLDGDRVKARLRGGHDEFPAYELYANGVLVYSYDPVAGGGTPWGLLGDGNWDVNPDTDYVDVGPATEYRIIGPVRIKNAQAQALAAIQKARTLSEQSISIHWDTVPYYPQSGGYSCWAASAAMIVGWRDNRPVADTEIADKVPVFDAYKTGLFPSDRRALADAWNLVPEPPASYTIDSWAQLLQTYGPLYVDMTWDTSGNGGHARVLVGMDSDGAPDGTGTTVYMHDPWPGTPGKIKLSFADFLALYEGRTGNEGGQLQYQILHADRVPAGRRAVTAAPFALTLASEAENPPERSASAGEPPTFSLAPAPPPISLEMGVRADAMVGPIAGAIIGALIDRVIGDKGDIDWTLDKLIGFKHPYDVAPNPALPVQNGPVIRLADWPKVTDSYIDDIYAGFEINWQYTGKSVGNVLISNITANDAVGWGLTVKATIMDDGRVLPKDNPTFAVLQIRFEYRFTHVAIRDQIAIVDVRLFGHGRYTVDPRWTQTGMF